MLWAAAELFEPQEQVYGIILGAYRDISARFRSRPIMHTCAVGTLDYVSGGANGQRQRNAKPSFKEPDHIVERPTTMRIG